MTIKIGSRSGNLIVPYSNVGRIMAGTIKPFAGSIASFNAISSDGTTIYVKDGWALCNGASISQTDFAQLFARISTAWNTSVNPLTGSAQSAPTSGYFRIPNLMGTFLRGVGDFSDNTKDTTLAGFQNDQFQGHKHEMNYRVNPGPYGTSQNVAMQVGSGSYTWDDLVLANTYATPVNDGINGTPRFGSESRPQNVGVYYLISLYETMLDSSVYIQPASDLSAGVLKSGIQGVNSSVNTLTAFRNVMGSPANKITQNINGILGFANLVTASFSFRYTNTNGTTMSTWPTIVIKDTTTGVVLASQSSLISVPSGFNDILTASVSCLLKPPSNTQYTIEAYEENAGGGTYSASNGICSVTVSKNIL